MMRTAVTALVMSILTWTFAAAQTDDLIAEGTGLGANKQEALMAAKRDAIEKGIGMVLLSQTEIENFMVKRDQVITKTLGAVKSYDVLSEGATPDNLYQMKIKASISRVAMREDLAAFHILIESMNKPRTMVIVDENNVGNDEPVNQAGETAVIDFLRDPYQFDLVDPQVSASIRSSKQKMAALTGDPAKAAAVGSQYGAEVIITGNAVAREATQLSKNLGGMISVQADVTLKAINCTTGRIIGTGSAHAAKVHISPNTAGTQSIAKASREAAGKLLDTIIKEWQSQLNNGITMTVTVDNVGTYRDKKAVVQTLEALTSISAVRERGWDGQSKMLTLDVVYKGNVDGFCSRVDGFKMKSGGGSIAVRRVAGMDVTLFLEVM